MKYYCNVCQCAANKRFNPCVLQVPDGSAPPIVCPLSIFNENPGPAEWVRENGWLKAGAEE